MCNKSQDWYKTRLNHCSQEQKKQNDHREDYERDLCRVIHSYPLRRLQGKIQIVSGNESDFHRNRLTHSLEVASVAQNIFRHIIHRNNLPKIADNDLKTFLESQVNEKIESLLFAIGLLHDIGHPPFGHDGEIALNYKMYNHGGFEGNAQTLRLITNLTDLKLTKRTLLGILKYPAAYSKLQKNEEITDEERVFLNKNLINRDKFSPPKCYYDEELAIVDQLLNNFNDEDRKNFQYISYNNKTLYKSFDCSIMDIADDISYGIHDLEDALFFNLISKDELYDFFKKDEIKSITKDKCENYYPEKLSNKDFLVRKEAISQLVHQAITDTKVSIRENFSDPLLKYHIEFKSQEIKNFIKLLQNMVRDKLIKTQHVKSIDHGGMFAIMQIFDAFEARPDLLPKEEKKKFDNTQNKNVQMRIISDYISGMTDQFLFKIHQRLFGANTQNTFDII